MNKYIANVRLTEDPRELQLGGKDLVKLRVADNPIKSGKRADDLLPRFVDVLCGNRLVDVARRLRKGDIVTIIGTLVKRKFTAKNGEVREAEEVPFPDDLWIQRSPSFFESTPTGPDASPPAVTNPEPTPTPAPVARGGKKELPF